MSAIDDLTNKENWMVNRTLSNGYLILDYKQDLSWDDIEEAAAELAALRAENIELKKAVEEASSLLGNIPFFETQLEEAYNLPDLFTNKVKEWLTAHPKVKP